MFSDGHRVREGPVAIIRLTNPADISYEGGDRLQHRKERHKCNEQVGGGAHCGVEVADVEV